MLHQRGSYFLGIYHSLLFMSYQLIFTKNGSPEKVLQLKHLPVPQPQPHQVRIAMRYAPINPADLNTIEGTYGRLPALPATPGNEGCGVIEACGSAVSGLQIGDAVICPTMNRSHWAQHLLIEAEKVLKLPAGIDLQQAAMLRVNPVTAWHLLNRPQPLAAGTWIAQNAANSAVGRALIQLARAQGLHTLNFVRRADLIPELIVLGADAVFVDDDAGLASAQKYLADKALLIAANAVGGDSALRLMELLSPGGQLITYGAMSRRSLKVPNKFLIFKNLQLHGLWISRWYETASPAERNSTLLHLAGMIQKGQLHTAIDRIYPLNDYANAIQHAQSSSRSGKVLLDLQMQP
jgi:mitochondrial enoyl-[acyl-carrier protein] reductase / trans-2-enoyl-CoA reductase